MSGPYSTAESLPAPVRTKVHTSRRVDLSTGTHMVDTDGNSYGQNDVEHLVTCTMLQMAAPAGGFVDERVLTQRQFAIRDALRPLVDSKDITIKRVLVEEFITGRTRDIVDYENLRKGLPVTFERIHDPANA